MTAPTGDIENRVRPGRPASFRSRSPSQPFMSAFEDDGDTAYFYALDSSQGEGKKVVDALQVYALGEDHAEMEESLVRIVWSADGFRSGLLLDGELRAVFDFLKRQGCSLSGFPPANENWKRLRGKPADMASLLAGTAVERR